MDKKDYSDRFNRYFAILVQRLPLQDFKNKMAAIGIAVFVDGEPAPPVHITDYSRFFAITDENNKVIGGYFA